MTAAPPREGVLVGVVPMLAVIGFISQLINPSGGGYASTHKTFELSARAESCMDGELVTNDGSVKIGAVFAKAAKTGGGSVAV